MPVQLDLVVANPAIQKTVYTHIKVYRIPNADAMPVEVSGPTTRPRLTDHDLSYSFTDPTGDPTFLYAISYVNLTTGLESEKSAWFQGTSDPALEVISVEELKQIYLVGVNLVDDKGVPYPPLMFKWYIQAAIDWLEHELDMPIREQKVIAERHDFFTEQFAKFTYTQLELYPVISVEEVRLTYPSQPEAVRVYPSSWVQLDKAKGVVEIVPSSGAISLPFFGGGGLLMPAIYGGNTRYVPHTTEVDYTAGFPRGKVPPSLKHLAGMIAAFGPLNIAGDLLGGPGIASYSMGLDGLTQAVSTTSSPQFAGYGARLWSYTREIKQLLPALQRFYKGIRAESA